MSFELKVWRRKLIDVSIYDNKTGELEKKMVLMLRLNAVSDFIPENILPLLSRSAIFWTCLEGVLLIFSGA